MFKFIINPDLELRLLGNEHAGELFQLIDANRPYLRQWLPWVDSNSKPEEAKEFIKRTRQQFTANTGYQAGIWYQEELCGLISLHNLDWVNKSASMGYWLGEKYSGQGIMTMACKALINYAFTDLKFNRIEIRCAEMNKRSRAIPERLGFKQEGILRDAEYLYDHYVNHVIYGILFAEWLAKRTIYRS